MTSKESHSSLGRHRVTFSRNTVLGNRHKSINMAKVLKRKVKGGVNIAQYDLWGTQRSVGDFRKTAEVTWKGAAGFGDSKKGS